jgi:hypothetical protein
MSIDRAEFDSSLGNANNHQQPGIGTHYRTGNNYENDLERDHALPTSAPNAEILKSNSNANYPNPNRHHNHDRHRHIPNSTSAPLGKYFLFVSRNIRFLFNFFEFRTQSKKGKWSAYQSNVFG